MPSPVKSTSRLRYGRPIGHGTPALYQSRSPVPMGGRELRRFVLRMYGNHSKPNFVLQLVGPFDYPFQPTAIPKGKVFCDGDRNFTSVCQIHDRNGIRIQHPAHLGLRDEFCEIDPGIKRRVAGRQTGVILS